MRVVFLGTPEFAVPTLNAIAASSLDLVAVFTQPDRPAGRGRKLTSPPVKKRAVELGYEVRQPERIRSMDIAPFEPDVAVVVAYGQILSSKFLSHPKMGVVNLHASLLPRWRGAAPIQRALLEGDPECGVCVMRVVKKLDSGPVLASISIPIGARDTSEDLHDRLAEVGGQLMVDTLHRLDRGEAKETPQDESRVTYAEKLSKGDADLDWSMSAVELDRRVRGLRPWPVAQTAWPQEFQAPVRIWLAYPVASELMRPASAGEFLGEGDCSEGSGIRIRTGEGDLILLELQPPGGKRMGALDFLRGHPLSSGMHVGVPK